MVLCELLEGLRIADRIELSPLEDFREVFQAFLKSGLKPALKKALKRRQAIEPWIGLMKSDGKLGRCYLKGAVGDRIHGVLVAIAHNFRMILRK